MAPGAAPTLTVSGAELAAALRSLARRIRRRTVKEPAEFRYSEGELRIELAGIHETLPASGRWPAPIEVAGSFVLRLGRLPPTGDVLTLRIADGRLHLGSVSVGISAL